MQPPLNAAERRAGRLNPAWAILLPLLLAALIAGCSGLRLGYRQADIILGWRAHQYFDLDADQRREFADRIDRLLEWHRYEQLPEYASFLTAAISKARRGPRPEDVAWFIEGIRARYRIVVNRGATDAAEMLATLAPGQIEALQRQWEKDNQKFASERELDGTPEKRKRARLKRTFGQIEDWTGTLTYEQEQKIAALLEPIPPIERLRYQDRLRRQQEFVELLKLRTNQHEFEPTLRAWLLNWERGRAPDYAQLSDEVEAKNLQFYVAVSKLLTTGQRNIALHRLQGYADDCKSLAHKRARGDLNLPGPDILAFFGP